MALWGTKDTVYSDGTIAISGTTVTGTGTTFNTSGLIGAGDVITVGTGASVGEAVIASVTNATTLVLHSACLLYTSPSPRDYAASRMPSSA